MSRLRALFGIRPGESRIVAPAVALAFLAVGGMTLSSIAADSLFVSTFSLGELSRFFVVSSAVRFLVALVYGALTRRFSGARTDGSIFAAAAAAMVLSGALADGRAGAVYVVALLSLLLPPLLPLVAFNSVVGCFHARQAKRLLPLVAAASTAGTIAVGAGATALATRLGTGSLLYLGAVLTAAAVWPLLSIARLGAAVYGGEAKGERAVARLSGGRPTLLASLRDTAGDVRSVPVVRVVVVMAVLVAAASNFVDFAFKASLKARYSRDEMAAFLGTFGVVANGLVLGVQLLVTSRFVGRFGVRAALTAMPASLLVLGPALMASPGLGVATSAKGAETVLRYSLTGSVQDLLLTPAPVDVRTRAKVFVKGAAGPLGYGASALILAAFGAAGPSSSALGALIAVAAGLAVVAASGARRAYTTALARAIDEGRIGLDVSPNSAAVLRAEVVRHLAEAAQAGDEDKALSTLAIMGDRFFAIEDLAPALRARSPRVRRAAIEAALRVARPPSGRERRSGASMPPPGPARADGASTDAGASEGRTSGVSEDGMRLLQMCPDDEDIEVERALLAAARLVGAPLGRDRAQRALVRALAGGEAAPAIALWAEALACLAYDDRDVAVKQLRKAALGADSARRAVALRILGELGERRAEREILRAMASPDPGVFAEAARAAVRIDAPGAIATLVMRLMSGPNVRAAAAALSVAGPAAVNELIAALPTTRGEGAIAPTAVASGRAISGTVRAARVLARLGPDACVRALDRFSDLGYRARNALARSFASVPMRSALAIDPAPVRRAMELTLTYSEALIHAYAHSGTGLLRGEIAHRLGETADRVLDLASVIADRDLIARARAALARHDPAAPGALGATPAAARASRPDPHAPVSNYARERERDRGNAMELLENVLPTKMAPRIIAVLEYEQFPADGTPEDVPAGRRRPAFDGWLEKCRMFDHKELVLEAPMLGVLEKVLVLRDSSLFMGLSGEELYPVAEIAQAAFFQAAEVVIRQGDPGDALFVVARGTLHVLKGDAKVREMTRGEAFGELALLDGAPRAATIVAATDAQLLRIPRAEFEALLDESPELARGVIRTLIRHLRGGA